eukprot:gene11278-biopygen13916
MGNAAPQAPPRGKIKEKGGGGEENAASQAPQSEREGEIENAAPQAPLGRGMTRRTWSSTQKAHMQKNVPSPYGHCTHQATRPPPRRSCLNSCRTDHAHSGTAQESA